MVKQIITTNIYGDPMPMYVVEDKNGKVLDTFRKYDDAYQFWLETLKSRDKTAQVQSSNEAVQLLLLLNDLKFEVEDNSQKTKSLLGILSKSNSRAAPIANQILSMNQQDKSSLFKEFNTLIYGEEKPVLQDVPQEPKLQETETHDIVDPLVQDMSISDITEEEEFNVEPVPASDFGSGAVAKNKQIKDFSDKYELMSRGLPEDVIPVPYGDVIPGVKVWPAAGGKGPDTLVKGGMYIKEFTPDPDGNLIPEREAAAVGLASDGRLAVRIFPDGKFDLWDLPSMIVRVSLTKAPKRDY